MTVITANHTLSTHEQMELFDQYSRRRFEVLLGNRSVGEVTEIVSFSDKFKVRVSFVRGFQTPRGKHLDGYKLEQINGRFCLIKRV